MSPKTSHLAGCPECDALQHVPVLHAGAAAHCVRCGAELFRYQPESLRPHARLHDRRGRALRERQRLTR